MRLICTTKIKLFDEVRNENEDNDAEEVDGLSECVVDSDLTCVTSTENSSSQC